MRNMGSRRTSRSNPARDARSRRAGRSRRKRLGFGLDARQLILRWDVTRFGNRPGQVEADIEYPLEFGDLPVVGAMFPTVVHAEHTEWVDPFRSGIGVLPGGGP